MVMKWQWFILAMHGLAAVFLSDDGNWVAVAWVANATCWYLLLRKSETQVAVLLAGWEARDALEKKGHETPED